VTIFWKLKCKKKKRKETKRPFPQLEMKKTFLIFYYKKEREWLGQTRKQRKEESLLSAPHRPPCCR
jgi:hypothetical protein